MSNITASMVSELRKETWAWMMACKKALVEAKWDNELAKDILRKALWWKAQSKMDRDTWEWRIFTKKDWSKNAIIKITCETDFVANNEKIAEFANSLLDEALANWTESAVSKWESEIWEFVWTIWENVKIEEIKILESEIAWSYIHSNWKIWVIIALSWASEETASELAMHVAAMNPTYLDPSELSDETVEKEKTFWVDELKWKPENIIENIMKWKEKKFRGENALKTQAFVKDPSMTCETYAKNSWAEITEFIRLSI